MDNLVSQVTCKANDTTCPCMNIRHDADFATAECGDVSNRSICSMAVVSILSVNIFTS